MTEKDNINEFDEKQPNESNVTEEEVQEVTEEQAMAETNEDMAVQDALPAGDTDVEAVPENKQVTKNNEDEDVPGSRSEAMESVPEIHVGENVQGEILVIEDNRQAIVGLGGGLEGVIPHNELSAAPFEDVTEIVNVGDTVDLIVI